MSENISNNNENATDPDHQRIRKRLDRLSWFLDSVVPLPGGFRLGLDGLVGLVPVVGDAVTALLSTYIIGVGVRSGASKSVIAKMLGNTLVDTFLGAVPVVGDLFDIAHRANYKNVKLLHEYLDRPVATKRASRLWVASVIIGIVLIIGLAMWAVISLLGFIIGLF